MDKPDLPSELTAAEPPAFAGQSSGGLGRALRLCRKELREVLRDRRTIITLIGMPLLVYPLLSLTFQKVLLTSGQPAGTTECVVGFELERDLAQMEQYLRLGGELLRREAVAAPDVQEASSGPALVPPSPELDLSVKARLVSNLERSLEEGSIDLAVRRLPDPDMSELPGFGPPLRCELVYREDSALSKATLDFVTSRLEAVNDRYIRRALESTGQSARLPAEVDKRSISVSGPPVAVTTVIPLILILMTITGAVYPAIDVTAGERERGTLEALMAAPVPRLSLLASKYVAVLTVAILTATANLVAMTVTLLVTPWGRLLFDAGKVSPLVVVEVFGLLILFAAFFSAILLAITSFARSFKEAQAYLIPLMLFSLGPGIVSLMPGIQFSGVLAVTPLVNIVLLSRELLEGKVQPMLATIAVLSTALYAVAAIGLAARVFGTDALLSGSRFGWRDLFGRPDQPRATAGLSGALTCLALMFPAYYLLSNLLALVPLGASQKLLLAAGVTMLLFGGFPLAAALLQRVRLDSAFAVRPASWLAFVAAALLGLTLWPLVEELFLLTQLLGVGTIDADKLQGVEQLLSEWQKLPAWLIVLCMAVAPAVFEELFFRGYLFTAIRSSTSPRNTILASAVLFGLFHVVTTSVLAVERLLPSTALGLILGWLCWRCGSVLPGVLLHACHNGLLLLIAYYRDDLQVLRLGEADQHLPWHWLAVSSLGLLLGVTLIMLACPRRGPPVSYQKGG
jgi:sodium transport system permease protein